MRVAIRHQRLADAKLSFGAACPPGTIPSLFQVGLQVRLTGYFLQPPDYRDRHTAPARDSRTGAKHTRTSEKVMEVLDPLF